MLDLLKFQKPQRYVGNELNAVKKSHFGKISFCICYPEVYEIGMDNLGLRIIYGLLNSYRDLVCERAFLPGEDLLQHLKLSSKPLFSLETKTPLSDFDLIGFNLGYELNYVNFLEMLDCAKIPLKSKDRSNIVIAGGIANPQPLADFVDVFCLGEFEETSNIFVKTLRRYKDKPRRLKALSCLSNFYVPQFYNFSFSNGKYIINKKSSQAAFPLKRGKVKNLNKSFFPLKWLTPHTKLIQDRVPVEIARGCPNDCNFCQAKSIYCPYRQRKIKKIFQIIKAIYKDTGYESFSLLSLSASDYTLIKQLLKKIAPYAQKNKISLSLPSLRIDANLKEIYRYLLSWQKASLTVAVESASPQLRKKLNKEIDPEQLFNSGLFYQMGLNLIKLYFMYGFPGEKKEDLYKIGDFIKKLLQKTRFKLNLSLNLFIPKPFSNWENANLLSMAEAQEKKSLILSSIPKSSRIKLNFSDFEKSQIEAVLSRADNKIAPVLTAIQKNRQNLVSEKRIFSWKVWERSFKENNIDWDRYLRGSNSSRPWWFIE